MGQLKLDQDNGLVCGVCAGIAKKLEVDPVWVRLFFFFFVLGDYGMIYVLLWLILPYSDD